MLKTNCGIYNICGGKIDDNKDTKAGWGEIEVYYSEVLMPYVKRNNST